MIERLLTDQEFGDILFETIRQMNALKRTLDDIYTHKSTPAFALAIATVIASCLSGIDRPTEQSQMVEMVNTTLSRLHQSWQLVPCQRSMEHLADHFSI